MKRKRLSENENIRLSENGKKVSEVEQKNWAGERHNHSNIGGNCNDAIIIQTETGVSQRKVYTSEMVR